jgi:ribonuclease D
VVRACAYNPRVQDRSLIDSSDRVDEALDALREAKVLAVDTEFFWERTYKPVLALVQVAGRDPSGKIHAYAFDPLAIDLEPLDALLGETQRLKVFHAGRIDLEILNLSHDEPLNPVFDTQIAAALCGFGAQIGYAPLVELLLGHKLGKSEQYADWTRRPLRPAQLEYALLDVIPLLDVYERLEDQLVEGGRRPWLAEELAHLTDPEFFVEPDPRQRYMKVKGGRRGMDRRALGALRELAAWREVEAQERDVRPSFVIKDPVLIDIARRQPKGKRDLEHVRGLHGRELKRSGKALLGAVDRAAQLPDSALPERQQRKRGAKQKVNAVVDLLRAFLHQRCEEVDVAVETVTTTKALEQLVRDTQRERFASDHPLLSGWRRELVGDSVLSILRGEVRLAVDPETQRLVLDSE